MLWLRIGTDLVVSNSQSVNNKFSGCILKQLTVSLWKLIVVGFFRIGGEQN
jgi:hypothetical protein